MIDELLKNPENLGRLIASAIAIGVFLYIIALSVLQVRQIFLLQQKVKTDADSVIRISTFAYLIIQVVLFVIALLFL